MVEYRTSILYDLAGVVVACVYNAIAHGVPVSTGEAGAVLRDFCWGGLLCNSCRESVRVLCGYEANATVGNAVGVECGGDETGFRYGECGNRHWVLVVRRIRRILKD